MKFYIKSTPTLNILNLNFRSVAFPVYIFQTKKTALDYFFPFLSFSVHNFCARTDGRTDRHFSKSFLFSSWSRIYIHVYTYLDYFSNFTPILTKVSIPFFFQWKWVWKWFKFIYLLPKIKNDQRARKSNFQNIYKKLIYTLLIKFFIFNF